MISITLMNFDDYPLPVQYGIYAALGICVAAAVYSKKGLIPRDNGTVDEPIIAGRGLLEGYGNLQSVGQGSLAGYPYNLLANGLGRVMMLVTLPKNTRQHIIALGDKSGVVNQAGLAVSPKWLEPVSLEGDFPTKFSMYCSKDRQQEVRQVFDPEIMAHFADFCRAYDFELFHDTIYVSQAHGARDDMDTTTVVADVETLLNENRQVFERL